MNPFSLTVAKIELFRRDTDSLIKGAIGTAFFYRFDGQPFLITNWHNVTGIHPETGQSLHSQGLIPNVLRLHYKEWSDDARTLARSNCVDLPLYADGRPLWYEHSSRAAVDVVALPVDEPEYCVNIYINEVDQEPRLNPEAGMDCFILGFPEGLFGAAFTPIWKRGSIAAEPFEHHPYLIDSTTRKGMSGSPVIIRHNGIFMPSGGGPLKGDEVIGTVERFVGIYSGRIGDDALAAQLGRAWPDRVLDDILTRATLGVHPLSG